MSVADQPPQLYEEVVCSQCEPQDDQCHACQGTGKHMETVTLDLIRRIVHEFSREVDEAEIVLPEGGTSKLLILYADDIRPVAERIVYGEPVG